MLAGAQIERHAGPTPVVDKERHGRVGVGLRVGLYAGFLAESGDILTADGTQQLRTLVAHGVGAERRAGLHGDGGHHLRQVILDHVAQGAGFLVVRAAAFHPDGFGGGDLHVIHVAAIPQRLEDAVAEAQRQDVLHGFLAEVMIDAVDLGFFEGAMQFGAELLSAGQVVAERLFDDDAAPAGALANVGGGDALRDGNVLAGLCGKVEQHVAAGMAGGIDFFQTGVQRRKKSGVVEVARHVEYALGEGGPDVGVKGRILQEFLDGREHFLAELIVGHGGARDTQDGESGVQAALVGQPVEGRQQLAFGEIAIGSEDDHGALGYATLEAQGILERIFQ